jgi:hypothetical protein
MEFNCSVSELLIAQSLTNGKYFAPEDTSRTKVPAKNHALSESFEHQRHAKSHELGSMLNFFPRLVR